MLVLSRKSQEKIVIDLTSLGVEQVIEIQVVEIRGDKVRIGIIADKTIPVHREEVYQLIHESA